MAMVSYCRCIAEKGGICYVSKPEEVWHLVLHPCGVALSVALFGKGRGVETPLSLILDGCCFGADNDSFTRSTLNQIFMAYFFVF